MDTLWLTSVHSEHCKSSSMPFELSRAGLYCLFSFTPFRAINFNVPLFTMALEVSHFTSRSERTILQLGKIDP